MSIPDAPRPGKPFLRSIPADALILAIIVLTGCLGFTLGVLAGKDLRAPSHEDGFWIEQLPNKAVERGGGPAAAAAAILGHETRDADAPEPQAAAEKVYVASKSGTKYYLPACGTAKRIKEENKVWFATKGEAEAAGYGPAANCPGL